MQFNYHRIDNLPKLAWCSVIEKRQKTVDVFHGSWVETHDSFFVEGAWDGSFCEGRFDESLAFMGTGARIVDEKVIFSTPSHIHERLHLIDLEDRLVISPSLAFALKKSGIHLDMNYIPYQVDLLKMIFTIKNHIGSIPAEGGHRINIYHFRNIEIDADMQINITHKKLPQDFADFESYKRFLIDALSGLFENANAGERKITYSPIAMMSTGYDSPACSILTMDIGLKEVLTFRNSRSDEEQHSNRFSNLHVNDSARKIADILGLITTEYDRLEVLKKNGFPEAEFMASGDLGQDFEISAMENKLCQRFVIVGYHGDKVWNSHCSRVARDIPREEAGGSCWIDFKFRVGYIFVPVPYIGCLSHPSIYRITNSKEMEPWRTWTKYDRPIARRIVEEKGVDRHLFGQKKKAISILLNRHRTILSKMSHDSAESFEKYYLSNKNKRSWSKEFYYSFMHLIYKKYNKLISIPNRVLTRLNIQYSIPCPIPIKFSQPARRPSFLVHWGISIIEKRYNT
jgi:hypothetical protein